MKENEAPEKIYLQVCGDCPQTDCENCKFEDFEDNITWCKDRIFPKDIEYTRTDAFIEKARKWFEKQNEWRDLNGIKHCDMENFEDFRNYMKGE
jgi:hypothetical protein